MPRLSPANPAQGLVSASNYGATQGLPDSAGSHRMRAPAVNLPAPTLLGSPFTSVAVTSNYVSHLHCEPMEHPFSYICWLDVLGAGTA